MKSFVRFLCRLRLDERGSAAMTYVVLAVLLVVAVVAIVLVFSGVLGDGFGTSGRAAAGQVEVAAESAAAARENFEVGQVRAAAAQKAIQGGDLPFGAPSVNWPDEEGAEEENGVKHPVAVEIGHTVLDLAGLIPGIGDAVDLANAAWYEKDGRHVEAAITAAAAVPVAGTAAVVVKWGNNATKLAKVVFKDGKIVKVITQEGKVLTKEGGKIAKETGKAGEKTAETTVSKNADNVVDISKKRTEKTGTTDNVIDARDGFDKIAGNEPAKKTGTYDEGYVDYSGGGQKWETQNNRSSKVYDSKPNAVDDKLDGISGGNNNGAFHQQKNPNQNPNPNGGNYTPTRTKEIGETEIGEQLSGRGQGDVIDARSSFEKIEETTKESERLEKQIQDINNQNPSPPKSWDS